MPLYLDEIWLNVNSPESAKKVHAMFQGVLKGDTGFPQGVTLKAGPWASNEEAKIILVLDIQDHAKTFVPFATAITNGLIAKRRLTPSPIRASTEPVLSLSKDSARTGVVWIAAPLSDHSELVEGCSFVRLFSNAINHW
ncbi:MAG: hypothetical protein HYZ72_14140 [Deltaproteobacteria bacterium]|nr:hypothetical protein [Deltaproteobacteria bacterium]